MAKEKMTFLGEEADMQSPSIPGLSRRDEAAQVDDQQVLVEAIERYRQQELLRFLTCGSVDDGKSTLIGRLLHDCGGVYDDQVAQARHDTKALGHHSHPGVDFSLLVDGLKAEREQGITIDVAYRYAHTGKRKFIIADCPGHEQYTRNMATGASTCDLAVILVDATKGVLPQTKRHSFIINLLGIKHVIVAINKMDLVGHSQARFHEIEGHYRDFAAQLRFTDVRFVPMCARDGDNVVHSSEKMPWYQGATLLHHLEHVHIASDRNLHDLRFPVQWVMRLAEGRRGLCGTVVSGVVRRGDQLTILPSERQNRVATILRYGCDATVGIPQAQAGEAVVLLLEEAADVGRGDMLVHTDNPPALSSDFEAMLVWLSAEPLVLQKEYLLKQTTRLLWCQVVAVQEGVDIETLTSTHPQTLALNEIGRCRILTNQPLCADSYAENPATGAFILIDRRTNHTVAAGMLEGRSTQSADHWQTRSGWGPALEWGPSRVTSGERAARFEQRPVTVLLTGLSRSGKSTLAHAVERLLFEEGRAACVLDGQAMRAGLSRDLDYSPAGRSENLRRGAEVARLLNDAGLIVLLAVVAPMEQVRRRARDLVGAESFLTVYLRCDVAVCRARDGQGIYAGADAARLGDIPGAGSLYEPPVQPDLLLDTETMAVAPCAAAVVELLRERGFLAPPQA